MNLGKFKIPGPNTVQPEIYNYFDVVNFTSTPNYYLITFFNDPIFRQTPRVGRAFFVFDKNRMQGWFLKRHNISSPDGIVESKMPVNNLDGLSEPKIFYSKSLNYDPHRIVCLDKLEISDILEYGDKGMPESNLLINNSYSRKLQKLLDNSSKEDNPIIRICYLK